VLGSYCSKELELNGILDLGKELSGRYLHLELNGILHGLHDEYKRARLALESIHDGLDLIRRLGDLGVLYKQSHGPGWYGILGDRLAMSGTVHDQESVENKLAHLVLCGSAVHQEHHDKLGDLAEWRKLLRLERGNIHDGLGLGDILRGNESRFRNVARSSCRNLGELVPSDILGGNEFRYHTLLLDTESDGYM
jgi:hypothetical protein